MYYYFMCNRASEELNKKYVDMVMKKFPNATITHALTDVDESKITCFDVDGKEIKLITDYTFDEISIDSEIELKVVKLD